MSFSLIDCWGCGPSLADYVSLAITAAVVVLPLFLWRTQALQREHERRCALGWAPRR